MCAHIQDSLGKRHWALVQLSMCKSVPLLFSWWLFPHALMSENWVCPGFILRAILRDGCRTCLTDKIPNDVNIDLWNFSSLKPLPKSIRLPQPSPPIRCSKPDCACLDFSFVPYDNVWNKPIKNVCVKSDWGSRTLKYFPQVCSSFIHFYLLYKTNKCVCDKWNVIMFMALLVFPLHSAQSNSTFMALAQLSNKWNKVIYSGKSISITWRSWVGWNTPTFSWWVWPDRNYGRQKFTRLVSTVSCRSFSLVHEWQVQLPDITGSHTWTDLGILEKPLNY